MTPYSFSSPKMRRSTHRTLPLCPECAGTVSGVSIGPMVPLTTAANPLAARILAAHLGAEGIVWQLRGNVDGPYPVGPVEVLVPADDLEVARAVVASADTDAGTVGDHEAGIDAAYGEEDEATADRYGRPVRTLVLVVGLVLVILFILGRVLVLGS